MFWLPYFFSSPGDCLTFTRAQSASSSSATAIGRLVREPVPISARCAMIVTMPLGSIETKTCGSVTTPPGQLAGAGGIGEGCARRHEFGGDDETAGREQAAQKAAAADILDRGVNGGHVTLLSRPP